MNLTPKLSANTLFILEYYYFDVELIDSISSLKIPLV